MSVKHSLIVPCYNEEGNVENFLREAKEAMKGYTNSYEIVFVNDGSKDSTPGKLREIFNKNKDVRIKVINFSRNFGKEAAMYAGFTQASTRPPTFVCFVNDKELFHYSYQRYIDNQIREVFGLEGTPTKFVIRERDGK